MIKIIKNITKVFKKDKEIIETIINVPNNKPLNETTLIMVYYINVGGYSRQMAQDTIFNLMSDYKVSEEELNLMGVKHVKEIWLPIQTPDTRVEIHII